MRSERRVAAKDRVESKTMKGEVNNIIFKAKDVASPAFEPPSFWLMCVERTRGKAGRGRRGGERKESES